MSEYALDEANNAPSRDLLSHNYAQWTTLPTQGTKRKAIDMDNIELSPGASQISKPNQLEPGLPSYLHLEGSRLSAPQSKPHSDLHSDLSPDIHSRSDEMEDEGTIITRQASITQTSVGRLTMLTRDISVSRSQEAEIQMAPSARHSRQDKTNGMLRPVAEIDNIPSLHQQGASNRPLKPRPNAHKNIGDVDYDSIPNYAPPISTLPTGNPRTLQIDWDKNPPADLSNDPDRHMLHEAELRLAATLNLSCARYLCIKRRIFQNRFEALKAGTEFTRIQARKASKISTQAAGRLYGAWEKVGWFDKKHFLGYLDESNKLSSPLQEAGKEDKNKDTPPTGSTELGIWDVSESEFLLTSDEAEESTDDETADGRLDDGEGVKNVDSYPDISLRGKGLKSLMVEGDENQQGDINAGVIDHLNNSPRNETTDNCPIIEDGRSVQEALHRETASPKKPTGTDTEELPMLETRSMTNMLKRAQNGDFGEYPPDTPTIKTRNNQPRSSSEKVHSHTGLTSPFNKRMPIPRSLREANGADRMLLRMKDEGRQWDEIEEALEKETGIAHAKGSLRHRYNRIMANFATDRLKTDGKPSKNRSLTDPRPEPDDVSYPV